MRRTCWLAVFAVALSPLAAMAQEYAIKIKRPGLGDKAKVKDTKSLEVEFKILDNNGIALKEFKDTKTHKIFFSEVCLERAAVGEEVVRLKRHYPHAERHIKGVRETYPYQGKTVLIEKKDGKFQFTIEGIGEASAEVLEIPNKDAQELHEEFNKGDFRKLFTDHFLPRKTVKVDETWKFEVAPLAKAFTTDGKIEIDDAKSTGVGKLLKAYKKNGKQFGVVELTITFPITNFTGDDGNKSPTKDSKIVIKIEADACIDGTLEEMLLKGSLSGEVRATTSINNMEATLMISLNATMEELRTPVVK